MRILLLNAPFLPKFSRQSRSPAVTKSGTIYMPILLSYCCGVLEKEGFDVKLVDAPAKCYTNEQVLNIIDEFRPQLVVIDTSTPSIKNDVKFLREIKNRINTFVILVGTHASALPEQTLNMSNKIDAIAIGEYDYTIKDLAHALEEGKNLNTVKGILYRKNEEVIRTEDRPFIENLNELPFVSSVYKKHLDIRDYFFAAAEYPMIMIFTGRGCPFKCFFCMYPQTLYGRKYRLRSAENVVEEFEYIIGNFPEVKEIGIEDDTFTADPERVRKICELLIEKGINKKIRWWANVRVNLDLRTMSLMKKAGCRLVIPGYESGVQEILNNSHKGITIEQSIEFANNTKKIGLLVHGCFIFGLPGETKGTIKKTIEFAKKLNPDTAQFFPLIVYPGTEAYEWAKKNGYLITEDYTKWLTPQGMHRTVINLPGLTSKELVEICNHARKEFYLRSGYIFYKIKQSLLHFEEAKRNLKTTRIFFKHIFQKSK